MKRLTFLKSLLVLPFVPVSTFARTSLNKQSEYQKCYDRTSSVAFIEGLTAKELDWFIKELLKVEPRGDLAGNFGKNFIIRFFRYLKDSEIKCGDLGFVGKMKLLSCLRVSCPEVFSDEGVSKFCGTFYRARFDQLLRNINCQIINLINDIENREN